MNLRDLNTALIEDGGFSYSLTFGDMSEKPYYCVAFAKASERVYDKLPTESDYQQLINDNITLLAQEDFIIGGWEHNGKYYVDVVELLPKDSFTLEDAIDVGRKRQQLAIHDLETGKDHQCKPIWLQINDSVETNDGIVDVYERHYFNDGEKVIEYKTVGEDGEEKFFMATKDPDKLSDDERHRILEYCLGRFDKNEIVNYSDLFIQGEFIKEVER